MTKEILTPESMKDFILENIGSPDHLEEKFRQNKTVFSNAFLEVYPDISHHDVAKAWNARLQTQKNHLNLGYVGDWVRILWMIFFAGLIVKISDFFGLDQEMFLQRNAAFIVFPFMVAQFYFKGFNSIFNLLLTGGLYVVLAVYVNLFSEHFTQDVFVLVCLHLPLLGWALAAYFRNGNSLGSTQNWIEFLQFNADIVIMAGLFLLSGAVMTAISLGLFQVIGWNIEFLITHYWLVWGLPAIPILAVFFVQNGPELVHKISPLIARVFSPIVLVILTGFLLSAPFSTQNPYEDRDFLIIFNVVLLGVMALIFFSLSEENAGSSRSWFSWIILALAVVTILVNGIALSAIIFRITSWGFTPNRVAVLASNLLMLTHLGWITTRLTQFVAGKKSMESIHDAIVFFLPLYFIWACLVVFGFPLLFR